MAELFAAIAPQIAVPVLWFYAENDEYIGPRVQKLWFESFRAAGGRGELVVVPPFPRAPRQPCFPLPPDVPLWTAAVAAFFKSQGSPYRSRISLRYDGSEFETWFSKRGCASFGQKPNICEKPPNPSTRMSERI